MIRLLPPPFCFLLMGLISVAIPAGIDRLHDRKVAVNQVQDVGGSMGFSYWKPEWLRQMLNAQESFWDPVRVSLGPMAADGLELDDEIFASVQEALYSFTRLSTLDVRRSEITDESAKIIGQLKQLSTLRLSETRISDKTIAELRKLKKLRQLLIDGTDVTDACLEDLSALKSLTRLSLKGTSISEDAVVKLSKNLPKCRIEF